jgi:tetratricopeptide (TPR) repeat protein/tRNA A-37 threonylcarbamoyl transferase component Bud32
MSQVDADRNLLFGVLALQDDLIDPGRFAEACASWALRKDVALAAILVERGWISAAEREEVERRLERKLKKHGGNAHATLAAVAGPEARDAIGRAEDPVVRHSLAEPPPDGGFIQVETLVKTSTTQRSRYTLTRLHAEGGLGKVWVARDVDLNREVALKEIRPDRANHEEARRRFFKEAQVTGQLEHPNIVPVYELSERPEDGQPFYTMRLVRGRTLRRAVAEYHEARRDGPDDPLALPGLLRAFVSVCMAVGYAHSRGVFHRDLKPENVVLGEFGEVIVLDWGLAKLAAGADATEEGPPVAVSTKARADETRAGLQLGTPAYMAPEQAEGRLDLVDARTDVYGLGAILFETLAGKPPHSGHSTEAVLSAIVSGPTPRVRAAERSVPPALDAICGTAMARARADRYAGARDLARDVERWLADEPVSVYRERPVRRLRRWAKKHRGAVQTAAAVALAVGALAAAAKVQADRRVAALGRAGALALDEGNRALVRGDDADAARGLTAALARVEAEPRLAELAGRLRGARDLAQQRLDEDAARRADRARYEKFFTLYDRALQHATLANAQSAARNRARIQGAAWEALGLYGLTPGGAEPPRLGAERISARERAKVKAGCYELLILLSYAELLAPGGAPRALALVDRAERLVPNLRAAREWRARVSGRPPAAPAAPDPAPGAGPDGDAALALTLAADRFLGGLVLYAEQAHVPAARAFEATLREYPDHYWAGHYLALCLIKTGRHAEAGTLLAGALARRPLEPWVHMLKAQAEGESGAVGAAEADYERALALAHDGGDQAAYVEYAVRVNRGAQRLRRGELPAAVDDLRRAAALEPDQPQAFVNLALAYQYLGRWDDAQREIDRAVALETASAAAAGGAPVMPEGQPGPGLRGLALAVKNRALILRERAEKDRALAEPRRNDLRAEAEKEFARALELEPPGSPFRLLTEAETLLRKGDLARALERLNRCESLQPADADFYQKRGQALATLKRYPEAVDDYTRSLQLAPSTNAFTRRGWALLMYAEGLAERDFDRAVAISEKTGATNLDGLIGRAYARVKLGRCDEGVADADRVPVARVDAWDVLSNLACVYAQAASAEARAGAAGKAERHAGRAVEVLRAALDRLPAGARPNAWRQLAADPALDPVRARAEFRALDAEHTPGAK